MRLHNAIRNVENAIATQKATPPDTDPMLKSRALESGFVTLVGKQDVLVKMLNAAAMQAQSDAGTWQQQPEQLYQGQAGFAGLASQGVVLILEGWETRKCQQRRPCRLVGKAADWFYSD
ncbi:hypothetical protein AX14_001464 [Amanita brunnescens Koide BX004]|nr:hypothetical protein AX14_001464 [Amanita brunnescens Koide BX004]